MAKSQAHKLGEFLGSFFEDLMKRPISSFASKYELYFDSNGERPARNGKKLSWTDINGSSHDLDFVLEKGGTESSIGEPIAFIELAWRSYTRHSKNKVQEISGALNPICEKYRLNRPFKGAILCGHFTDNSLNQLKADSFHVLYIPFEKMVQAFRVHGFDIFFDDKTRESEIRQKYAVLSKKRNIAALDQVREELLSCCEPEITAFISELEMSYLSVIEKICILPLHGAQVELSDVESAVRFISNYNTIPADQKLEYIEVVVYYNDENVINGRFKTKERAISFLEQLKKR